ncbi:MAG: LytTR family DNA-binding domain-containing protein [Lachnospiraceae bacterium]|nr:LytTR family DNA-binding domain-containing protein [Lachnospiraceae bacterium]
MNIAIVDDISQEVEPLRQYLREYAAASHVSLTIKSFDSAEELLKDYRPYTYTAVFLDIYMKKKTGIDAAKEIREQDAETLLIFLTSSMNFMPEAFTLHAYEYMEKPVQKDRVFRLMDDIKRLRGEENTASLHFVSKRVEEELPYGDIVIIRSTGNYQEIEDKDGNIHKTRMSFGEISGLLLQDSRFLMVLRGEIVNMDYIIHFDPAEGVCHIRENIHLPINLRNMKKLEQTWQNYTFNKIRKEHKRKA